MGFLSCGYDNLPEEVIEHLHERSDILDMLRSMGYGILKFLAKAVDFLYTAIDKILSFNFYNIPAIQNLVSGINPIITPLAMLTVIISGCFILWKTDKVKVAETTKGILTSILLIVMFPACLSAFSDMKDAGIDDVSSISSSSESGTELGKDLIGNLVIDIDSSRTAELTTATQSNINPYCLNINETLDNNEFWSYKVTNRSDASRQAYSEKAILVGYFELDAVTASSMLIQSNESSLNAVLKEIASNSKFSDRSEQILQCKSVTELFSLYTLQLAMWTNKNAELFESANSYYHFKKLLTQEDVDEQMCYTEPSTWFMEAEYLYAYDYNFLAGLCVFAAVIVALAFMCVRISKLMYEVVFVQIIAPIVFSTDMQGSGRSKKVLQTMISLYTLLIIMVVIVKMFCAIITWGATSIHTGNWLYDSFLLILVVLGGALFVIDGSDLIVSLCGIDAGVKSAYGAIKGAETVAKVPGKAAGAIFHSKPAQYLGGKAMEALGNAKDSAKESAIASITPGASTSAAPLLNKPNIDNTPSASGSEAPQPPNNSGGNSTEQSEASAPVATSENGTQSEQGGSSASAVPISASGNTAPPPPAKNNKSSSGSSSIGLAKSPTAQAPLIGGSTPSRPSVSGSSNTTNAVNSTSSVPVRSENHALEPSFERATNNSIENISNVHNAGEPHNNEKGQSSNNNKNEADAPQNNGR